MKILTISRVIASGLLGLGVQAQTITPTPSGGALPDWQTWTVTARDGSTTTRQLTQQVIDPLTGEATNQTRTLIEVATGLNYQDASGAWQESQDAIALTPGGGAAALQGPLKVLFSSAGLNQDDAITLTTPKGQSLNARVQGVYYFDSQSGQSQLLAAPSDTAVAERLSPNQIIYRNAFLSDVFQADLRYTYTKAGYESDLIVTRQPKLTPEACGLNPATTLLQVRHEWRHAPPPASLLTTTAGYGNAAVQDQFIDLGDVFFPAGSAVLTEAGVPADTNAPAPLGSASLPGAGAPVGKEWQQGAGAGGSDLLIESVSWPAIVTNLARLPLMASVDGAPWTDYLADAGAGGNVSGGAPPAPVLVLDYTAISGGTITNYVFGSYSWPSGPTYVVTGSTYLYGTSTFQPNCVIKFANWSRLTVYGSVVCNGDPNDPSVLTSWTDNQYGQVITGLSGLDQTMLWLYPLTPANITLNALAFRYANIAMSCQGPCSCGGASCYVVTLNNCSLYNCSYGLGLYGMSASIVNSAVNSVGTALFENPGCTYNNTGTFSQGQGPSPATTAFQVANAQQPGNNVTFSAPDTLPTVVNWCSSPSTTPPPPNGPYTLVGTGSTLSLNWTQPGAFAIYASKYNPFGTNWSLAYYLAAASGYGYNSLMTFVAETNGQTSSMWVQPLQAVNPPGSIPGNYQWNPHSILYGKGGFTAISQLNWWNLTNNCTTYGCPGQDPMTALTRRHVISSGHSFVGKGGAWKALDCGANGAPIWFCDASDNIFQMTAVAGFGQNTNADYSVFLLNQDLPPGISPMSVDTTQAEWWPIYLQTDQFGQVAAYTPGFPTGGTQWLPPFNNFTWGSPGDSGSPTMLLTAGGQLVLVGATLTGPATTGENLNNIQADMNLLISNWNSYPTNSQHQLNPANYQMQYWNDALGPVRAP